MIRLALIFAAFAGLAEAQTTTIRSGNHPDFVRLVIAFPDGAEWQVGRTAGGYGVRFDRAIGDVDIASVFARIPRDRIGDIRLLEDGFDIAVDCACHADAFLWQENRLVVDVVDGPAPTDSPLEAALAGPEPGTAMAAAPGPALDLPILPYWPEAAASPLSDMPDTFADQDDRAWIAQAEEAVLEGIAGAASAGLLEVPTRAVLDMIVEEDGVGVRRPQPPRAVVPGADSGLPAPVSLSADVETPGIRLRDAMAGAGPDEPGPGQDSSCFVDALFQVQDWGDERPFHTQVSDARSGLTGEFDRYRNGAVEALARTYLYFGFGLEAKQALALDGSRSSERLVLETMADIVDEAPIYPGVLHDQTECIGAVSLWSLLATGDAATQPEQARIATVQTFRLLPVHLRGQIGPRIAALYVAAGDAGRADAVLQLTRSHREPGSIDAELTEALTDLIVAFLLLTLAFSSSNEV